MLWIDYNCISRENWSMNLRTKQLLSGKEDNGESEERLRDNMQR